MFPLQVTFPGVGQLLRNRAGRIEFVFEQQLVEALELGLAPVSSRSQGWSSCVDAWCLRTCRGQHPRAFYRVAGMLTLST